MKFCNNNNDTVTSLYRDNTDVQSMSKPRRPRTAYNFFFRSERKNILLEAMKQEKGGINSMSPNQVMRILQADRDRPHRKLHGMVSFRDLTTKISSKWRSLDSDTKKIYQDLSAEDKIRYRQEIKQWREAQILLSNTIVDPVPSISSAGSNFLPSSSSPPPPGENGQSPFSLIQLFKHPSKEGPSENSSMPLVHLVQAGETPSFENQFKSAPISHVSQLASQLDPDCVSFLVALKEG
mmetsp:Transcript_25408/g.39095  ORF Transcript_25408/g.39095 Transcript_25408/m.39095 type:complete len:237 (-) Transcript_25408:2252-2962(-)